MDPDEEAGAPAQARDAASPAADEEAPIGSGNIGARIAVRIAELGREIDLLEARQVVTNEPVILALKAQLAELEALLAGDADWRPKVRERRVVSAAGGFMASRRQR